MAAANLSSPAKYGFASTHWTTIRACTGNDNAAYTARAELCKAYWYPVYAYIKQQGNQVHYAEDLTQDFFAYVLERPWFERVDQNRGKFRSFLLGTLKHFLSTEVDRKDARRREGRYQHIPYDQGSRDGLYPAVEARSTGTEAAFEVEWAAAVVTASLKQLEAEYTAARKTPIYQHLSPYLKTEGDASSYETAATELCTSLANVKVSVHRLRKRYAAILREQVAATVAAVDDVEDEMRYLRTILSAG